VAYIRITIFVDIGSEKLPTMQKKINQVLLCMSGAFSECTCG